MNLPIAEIDPFNVGQPVAVDSFYSSALKGNDAHRYPGERPPSSFVTDGESVIPMAFSTEGALVHLDGSATSLDEYLGQQGLPVSEDRIPIVGYGSNVCPPTLARKLDYEGRPDLKILPVMYGWMSGVDAVWHERPGQRGAFFAEMYAGEETEQTSLRVGVGLFTPEQLLFIHKGEQTYDLGQFSTVELDNGHKIPALMYVGSERILEIDGSPVAVSGIERQNPGLTEMTSRETLDCLLEKQDIRQKIADIMECDEQVITTDAYTEYVQNLPTISAKRAFNDRISEIVRIAGLSSEFSMSKMAESDLSWSNPSTLPTFGDLIRGDITGSKLIRLPEQDIPRGIGDEEKRQLVLKALRKHWYRRNDRPWKGRNDRDEVKV